MRKQEPAFLAKCGQKSILGIENLPQKKEGIEPDVHLTYFTTATVLSD